MELAIINGTYRDSNTKVAAAAGTVRRTCLIIRARRAGGKSGVADLKNTPIICEIRELLRVLLHRV